MSSYITKLITHPLFKSGLVYTVSDAINKSVPFFLLPVLSYYLLPGDYGIIANFNVLLSVITILITIGVDGAISVNYYKLSREDLAKYIFNGIVLIFSITLLVSLLLLIFHIQVQSWTKIPFNIQLLVIVMALSASITALNLSLWRLEGKALFFGVYEISQTVVNISASLVLVVMFKMGWIGRVEGMFLATVLFGGFSFYLLFVRGYLKINFNKFYLKEILFFGLPLVPHALSFWIRSGVDRIFITRFIGETATGLYATGFQFGILISFLTLSFNNAFSPYIYKNLSEKDEGQLQKNKTSLVKITYLGISLLAMFCLFFTVFSNFILTHFFSKNYIEAKEFVFYAILSQTFQGMYLLFVNYIFFAKKTKLLALITFGSAVLQVIMSLLMIPRFGALGAAYSTVFVSFINFIAVAIYSSKVYKMPWLTTKIISFQLKDR